LGTKKKCQDKSICKGTSKKNAVKYIYIQIIIIIIQKIVPKEISLHHFTLTQQKKNTNSPKPHSPERSTWSRPDVADRAQDVDTGAEVQVRCPRVGLVGSTIQKG